jgi:hypothetical protein
MHMHIPHHILPTERISANVALFDPYLIVIKGWEQNAVIVVQDYQRHHTHVHTHIRATLHEARVEIEYHIRELSSLTFTFKCH